MTSLLNCAHCGSEVSEMDVYNAKPGPVCWDCFYRWYDFKCPGCQQNVSDSEVYSFPNGWGGEFHRCEDCAKKEGLL